LLPGLLMLPRYDLIHLHFPFYFGAELAAFTAWRWRTPLVVTYHQDMLRGGLVGWVARLHDRTLGAWILRLARRVCFSTLDYARHSKMSWLLNIPGHVAELPNGVDTDHFHPRVDGSTVRQRLRIPETLPLVLMVASLDQAHYFKGLPVLLQAIKQLSDLDLRLVVVGEGDLRAAYQNQADQLGLRAKVIFTGSVSQADLPAYYAAADLVVLPSVTMGEAFGVVLLEAFASARPVIASRLPGVRVVVSDGEDGFLVVPADVQDLCAKLQILLADPDLRRKMGERGREKAARLYSWPAIVARLENLYREIIPAR
jgi:glycosyltransferase involved in cell wall biosynthesis